MTSAHPRRALENDVDQMTKTYVTQQYPFRSSMTPNSFSGAFPPKGCGRKWLRYREVPYPSLVSIR